MDYKPRVGCVFMHVGLTDTETVNNEDDIEIVEVNILPPNFTSTPDRSCIEGIFNAMNICADFHPDPDDSEEEDEEDETAPGATGWITAENMGEYLDENGNFRGQVWGRETVELGPGAGTVRPREEDGEGQADVNGGDDTKWQRTG
jgi:nucleotide-sensitive chloride channel 1A